MSSVGHDTGHGHGHGHGHHGHSHSHGHGHHGHGPSGGDAKTFNPDALVSHFVACQRHATDVPMADFIAGCEEVKKIVFTLGSAFALASNDITEKTGILTARLHELEEAGRKRGMAPPMEAAADSAGATTTTTAVEGGAGGAVKPSASSVRLTLQFLVLSEVERGVEKMNSPGKFVSGSRSILRLMWFLDFLSVLLGQLLEGKKELRECAQAAYDVALAPHHPWILRKTIGTAIYFLPSRDTFWTNLAGTTDPAVLRPKMQAFLDNMEPVRVQLWGFYRAHGLTELP